MKEKKRRIKGKKRQKTNKTGKKGKKEWKKRKKRTCIKGIRKKHILLYNQIR